MSYNLIEDYQKYRKICDDFDSAKAAGDESGVDAAKKAMGEFNEFLNDAGVPYWTLLRNYSDSMKAGNEFMFLQNGFFNKDIPPMADLMKKSGIKRFFLGGRSTADIENAYSFQENGYKVVGMKKVFTGFEKAYLDENKMFQIEEETVPALIFELQE